MHLILLYTSVDATVFMVLIQISRYFWFDAFSLCYICQEMYNLKILRYEHLKNPKIWAYSDKICVICNIFYKGQIMVPDSSSLLQCLLHPKHDLSLLSAFWTSTNVQFVILLLSVFQVLNRHTAHVKSSKKYTIK